MTATVEQELRVAQELLFLVLDEIDQPVILNVEEAREKMNKDRMIELELDEEAGTWTLFIKDIPQEVEGAE